MLFLKRTKPSYKGQQTSCNSDPIANSLLKIRSLNIYTATDEAFRWVSHHLPRNQMMGRVETAKDT